MKEKFPHSTIVGTSVPKKTFTEQLGANARMKEHFTRDVERITWLAKLAPSTLPVADGKEVHEISVFLMQVKSKDCPTDIFAFIDTWMPRHTLFILEHEAQACVLVHFKEKSQAASEKQYNIIQAYRSEWQDAEALTLSLEGQSMDAIYENLVRQVAGKQLTSTDADLKRAVELTARQAALRKEIAALERKEAAERQPTKKFQLHQRLVALKRKTTQYE